MIIMIIDTETTGLDTSTAAVIEMAAALLDVESKCILSAYSTLIHSPENPAEKFNNIPTAALQQNFVKSPDLVPFVSMALAADVIVAHNAGFDQPLVDRLFSEYDLEMIDKPWICSASQLVFPMEKRKGVRGSRKLTHLAVDHEIPVFGAHRAMTDVFILGQLLCKMPAIELCDQIIEALKPKHRYFANISFEERLLAKEAGFKFMPDLKRWEKDLTEDEIKNLPFEVVKVDD